MKIIVTGGAGFIGSHLVDRLTELGHDVIVIDNLSSGSKDNFKYPPNLIVEDIRDRNIGKYFEDVECVYHLAALRAVQQSIENPKEVADVNILGTINVLKDCKNIKRFIYASSSSVYGQGDNIPISLYAITKLAGEVLCRTVPFETVCLRYFNVFGPRQSPNSKYAAVIPIFIENILTGTSCEIHGDGTQSRDFTYIDNVTDTNIRAINCPVGAFDVGCGQTTSVLKLYELIKSIMGKEVGFHITPRLKGDVDRTLAKVTYFRPKIFLVEGLKRTAGWLS